MHAALTNNVFYANPNKESRKYILPEVANNPTIVPPEVDRKRMALPDAVTNDVRRSMTRIYMASKTGV